LKRLFTILLFLIFLSKYSCAQNITGTWEGDLDGDEFLQINIIQVGDKICGYTWDYVYERKRDYCKAYFTGSYDKKNDVWFLSGYSFMANSGGHVLMQLRLRDEIEDGDIILRGFCRTKPSFFLGAGDPSAVKVKKVSNRPYIITDATKECVKSIEPPKKIKTPPVITPKKIIPPQKNPIENKKKDSVINTPVIVKPRDSITKIIPPAKRIGLDTNRINKTNERINKVISSIVVNDRKITLNVYDNGTIDGDSVTIFYNGRIIMSHKRLSDKPLLIDLTLDENTNLHSIVLFAENLGSIPPNTALIIFTTSSGKRYELLSSATLSQNAELIFEYKPK
jgi:hypothetical protein